MEEMEEDLSPLKNKCSVSDSNNIKPGRKRVKCEQCGKDIMKRAFKLHSAKHSGEKPYACEYCPGRFADPSVLNSHRKIMHGQRGIKNTLSCNICDQVLNDKGGWSTKTPSTLNGRKVEATHHMHWPTLFLTQAV